MNLLPGCCLLATSDSIQGKDRLPGCCRLTWGTSENQESRKKSGNQDGGSQSLSSSSAHEYLSWLARRPGCCRLWSLQAPTSPKSPLSPASTSSSSSSSLLPGCWRFVIQESGEGKGSVGEPGSFIRDPCFQAMYHSRLLLCHSTWSSSSLPSSAPQILETTLTLMVKGTASGFQPQLSTFLLGNYSHFLLVL